MNRKQEIAAWLFGLMIVTGLLLSGHGLWALALLAVLTIVSLRDRHRKNQPSPVHTSSETFAQSQVSPISGSLETEYKGTTNRWNESPGCFERHLQRKEGNALFPVSERRPTDEEISQARAKDNADLDAFRNNVAAFFERAKDIPPDGTTEAGVVIDWLRYEVSPLLTRAAEIGEPARKEFRALTHILEGTMKGIDDTCQWADSKALRGDLLKSLNFLLRQIWRSDTPIGGQEITSTLLCESTEMIRDAVDLFEQENAGSAQALYQHAVGLLQAAAREGFILPAAEEKLAFLKAYATGEDRPSVR